MTFAGAGLADDQRIAALGDELQRVELEARLARQLGVEAPVEVVQCLRSSSRDCVKRRCVSRDRRRSSSSCKIAENVSRNGCCVA
jgi:hypothetical protein